MDQLESLLNRPKAYYNIDGVGELGTGFMCLGYALLQWMQVHAPQDSVWHSMWMFLIYVALMGSIIHYGSKAIKKHITYPRTGFVEYRKRDTHWRPMIFGFIVSAALSAGLVLGLRRHWHMTTPVSLIGLLFAATYAHGIARTVRWKWAVVWVVALGSVAIAVLPADVVGAVGGGTSATYRGAFLLTMMLYGAVLLVSGGISFWLYLRHTEAPVQEAQ